MQSKNMSKTDEDAQQFTIGTAIKNIEKMTSELKKLIVKTQLLLCDLTLTFSHPAQADVSRENDDKNQDSEELTIQPANTVHYHSFSASHQ